MRKFVVLAIACCFSFSVFCADSVYDRNRPNEVKGWSVFSADDDIDETGFFLITELDSTYSQMASEDALEVVSASTLDTTQVITLTGIDNAGNRVSEDLTVNGTSATATSDTIFRYIDQVKTDKECVGVITVRSQDYDTFHVSIPAGVLDASVSQHFNGEKKTRVTSWSPRVTSTTGTLEFQLRYYPDDADSLDDTDGYRVLDSVIMTNALDNVSIPFSQPIECEAGGWLAVFAKGGSANADGAVLIQGVDVSQ